MTTIVTRAGKGSPLTNTEVDTNFTNLNIYKVELTDLSVTTNAPGAASLSYNSGEFTFTPPDLSNFITSVSWGDILTKPTTIAGFGITDAYTKTEVNTQISSLVDSAPGTLDTLNELAAALGDDPNFATSVNTSLSNRLRVDTSSQGLTSTQQSNAITNLGLDISISTDLLSINTDTSTAMLDVTTNAANTSLISLNNPNSQANWYVKLGQPGNYDGYLMIGREGQATPGDFYITSSGLLNLSNGLSIGDGQTIASMASGSLAFYKLYDNNNTSETAEIRFRNNLGTKDDASFVFNANNYNGTAWETVSNILTVNAVGASSAEGRVGVNTNTPTTALDVIGTVTADSIISRGGVSATGTVTGSNLNIANWNTAYGWGDHGIEGYITGNETITLSGDVSGSGTTSIAVTVANDSHTHDTRYYTENEISNFFDGTTSKLGYNKTNWDTAFSWGDHGTEGYITGNETITLSGDVSGSGTTSIAVTVANDSHTHDTRYYTETELDGFFEGVVAKTGYNKADWDEAYGDKIDSASFNNSTGLLSLNRQDAGVVSVNLDGRYLTSFTETDPVFGASEAASITSTDTTNWNTAYGDKINSASFSTSTGVLTLTRQDAGAVTVDLDGRYLQSYTETDTLDSVTDRGATTTNDVTIGSISTANSSLQAETTTLATTTTSVIASFSATTYGGGKFVIQASSGGERHICELLVTHNGTAAVATQYASITTAGQLATYEVDVSGGNVRLLATGVSTTSRTYKVSKELLAA